MSLCSVHSSRAYIVHVHLILNIFMHSLYSSFLLSPLISGCSFHSICCIPFIPFLLYFVFSFSYYLFLAIPFLALVPARFTFFYGFVFLANVVLAAVVTIFHLSNSNCLFSCFRGILALVPSSWLDSWLLQSSVPFLLLLLV